MLSPTSAAYMSDYYDRQGRSLDPDRWANLFSDRDYQSLIKTLTSSGMVSTVWLGLDHSFGTPDEKKSGVRPPLIFETLVYKGEEEIMYRYSTEEEAIQGHWRVVQEVGGDGLSCGGCASPTRFNEQDYLCEKCRKGA